MKTEPNTYSIDDLAADGTTPWDGVRNYQARNFMRDQMQPGDTVFIYHSNISTPAIVGLATVSSQPYPDETQFDESSDYFDEKASREAPRWFLVDVRFQCKCDESITRDIIKQDERLADMLVVQKRGSRLSVQPVEERHASVLRNLCA